MLNTPLVPAAGVLADRTSAVPVVRSHEYGVARLALRVLNRNSSSLQISDGVEARTTVTVRVTGVNDHRPLFRPNEYSVAVAENASVGSEVAIVRGLDGDAGGHGAVVHRIVGGNLNSVFSIDPPTGDWLSVFKLHVSVRLRINRKDMTGYERYGS